MPNRKLINQVVHVPGGGSRRGRRHRGPAADQPPDAGRPWTRDSEAFRLARALLTGEDVFGVEFIAAYREGKLGAELSGIGSAAGESNTDQAGLRRCTWQDRS